MTEIQLRKENILFNSITTGKVPKYQIGNITPYTTYEIFVNKANLSMFNEKTNCKGKYLVIGNLEVPTQYYVCVLVSILKLVVGTSAKIKR